MPPITTFSSKLYNLLKRIAEVSEYSSEWAIEMETFLPYFSEQFFCISFVHLLWIVYKNVQQLESCQHLLLDLWNHILDMLSNVFIRPYSFIVDSMSNSPIALSLSTTSYSPKRIYNGRDSLGWSFTCRNWTGTYSLFPDRIQMHFAIKLHICTFSNGHWKLFHKHSSLIHLFLWNLPLKQWSQPAIASRHIAPVFWSTLTTSFRTTSTSIPR